MSGWIGVDLDGTLAHYEEWEGPLIIGEPIPLMVDRVKRWISEGREVRIFTARVSPPSVNDDEMLDAILKAISEWCFKHIGTRLAVTCIKDYHMLELWDDRAVQVEKNTGRLIKRSTRGLVNPRRTSCGSG